MTEDSPQSVDLRVVTGSPTAEELAALTAVVTALLDEAAAGEARSREPVVSAWERSRRALRGPLTRGPGAWRSFSG